MQLVQTKAGQFVSSVLRVRSLVIVTLCLAIAHANLGFAAEPSSRQLLPPGSAVILEVRQPQVAFQHALVKRLVPILAQSRAVRDALGNPDFDIFRDSIQHFETQLGISVPQIIESCAGEGLLLSASSDQPQQFAAILTGRDPEKMARLPEVTLSLARKIAAGRGQNLPDPVSKSHQGHAYFQFGEAFYSVAGNRWMLSNQEAVLQGMLDRLDGKNPNTETELSSQLAKTSSDTPGVRLIADLPALKRFPKFNEVAKWPPKDIGAVILAAGWLDLAQRSRTAIVDIDLGHDALVASVKFPTPSTDASSNSTEKLTPGTVGFFASDPGAAAAPLLEPPHLIYSLSWYRDYWKMWENRANVPLPDQVANLETQIASVEKGNLGYSGFDMIRLLGPHHRVVVTRPGPNPYKVEMLDRLPTFGLVLELKDEKEFKDRVLLPVQRILGIVAVTNKMVGQTLQHGSAEISALRFTEDPVAVKSSDRVRYNFEPSYSVTRGHLIIGSTSHLVRTLVDELDRIKASNAPVQIQVTAATSEQGVATTSQGTASQRPRAPGSTEFQKLQFDELANVLTDLHGLAVRNSVLNDGLTISEAEAELSIVQQIVTTLGEVQVAAGFDQTGFEYRIHFALKATR
jgi:hypothetical protein